VARAGGYLSHNAWRPGGEIGPDNVDSRTGGPFESFDEFLEKAAPHDLRVDFDDFVNIPKPDWEEEVPRYAPFPVDTREFDFAPADESPVIDAGMRLRGINDDFVGDGPDMGAREKGRPAPHYGPRKEPPAAPNTTDDQTE
jgi:hypothetical protein